MTATQNEVRTQNGNNFPAREAVRNIATFHLNGLGDLIFTLPALAALRTGFPNARICAVLRLPLVPLLQHSPFVDEILLRPKDGFINQIELVRQLRARKIDLAVGFSQSRHTTFLARASGAKWRAGFENARLEKMLTLRVPKNGPPRIETHLDLVRALHCPIAHDDYCGLLSLSSEARRSANDLLKECGISEGFVIVACDASARRGIKEWPLEHWAAALREIARDWPIVLVGTRPLPALVSAISHLNGEASTCTEKLRVFDIGGRTDLLSLAALCERARLFVGIDSGVMHLAAAMKTPVVGIYGPSDWRLTGPRSSHRIVRHDVECSPCFLSQCLWTGDEERKCLTRLLPQQVVQAARELTEM